MLQVNPDSRLDIAVALQSEVLSAPLDRAREALNLEEPQLPEGPTRAKRSEKMRKEVQEATKEMKSEWIGYNTMCRRAAPILPAGVTPEEALAAVAAEVAAKAAAAEAAATGAAAADLGATGAPENWSTKPERDPESGEEGMDSVSDDS